MRGWVFLSKCEPHSQMLRGEGGSAQFVPSCAYWGGVYPRQGGLSVVDRWGCRREGGAIPLHPLTPADQTQPAPPSDPDQPARAFAWISPWCIPSATQGD
jgi:hypothetical protein